MTGLPPARPALTGITVLDLTRLLPGNYATLLLAGLGADVIKIEELTGDGTRAAPPYAASGDSGPNLVLNRRKSSLALNLKDSRAVALLLQLVSTSDVMLDSFRPGVLDRLGLGPAALAQANPALVHVSLTAYGADGPYAALPSHDLNVLALAGVLGMSVDEGGRPAMPATQAADLSTGAQAALAVLAGLRVAERTGEGYRAEVTMQDSALSLTALAAGHLAAGTGSLPAPRDLLTGALACYNVYRTADDRYLALGALEPKFFARTCELLGAPELTAAQYDLGGQEQLGRELAAIFATRSLREWTELLVPDDTCVTPVNDLAEAFADPNATARGVVVDAVRTDGSAAPVLRAVPWLPQESGDEVSPLGSDAVEVLARVGVSAAEVAELRAAGVVGGTS